MVGSIFLYGLSSFATGWRSFVIDRRGTAIRGQMVMIAVATLGVLPLLSLGSISGQGFVGAVAPVGLALIVGAAMFGVGMQLAGTCSLHCLVGLGAGSPRLLLTLIFFITGAFFATAHLPWWRDLLALEPIALGELFGVGWAVFATLILLAAICGLTFFIEFRGNPQFALSRLRRDDWWWIACLAFPWRLVGAAVALGCLAIMILILNGHSWEIVPAFRLWGAKLAQSIGIPVDSWTFWTGQNPAIDLKQDLLLNRVTLVDLGIIAGAALVALIANLSGAPADAPTLSNLGAAVGGLLMGYGATISPGCNIGAMMGGITSGSVHGWVWFAVAFAGSYVTIRLRAHTSAV
jgi:uncharacterized membrane protein YedE/YeeE